MPLSHLPSELASIEFATGRIFILVLDNFFAYYPEILTRADSESLIGCIVCM
jgi:hypothetical protein